MIAWWVAAALAAPSDAAAWEGALSGEAYRFCHDPGAHAALARDWCELLDDAPPDACPGLRATCDGAAGGAELDDVWEQMRNGCQGQTAPRGFAEPPEPPPRSEACSMEPPPEAPEASPILRWIGALLVAVVVIVAIRLLVAYVGWQRRPRPARAEPAPPEIRAIAEDEVPELPSRDLLAAARRALGEGRYGDAVLLSRGAALRALGDRGRVELHRARTDREYVRSLRDAPDLHQPMREVIAAVEAHRWGGRAIAADAARAAVGAAERVIAAIGAAALVGWLLAPGDARANRYDPYGDAALLTLYTNAGYDAGWRLRGLRGLEPEIDVLVLDLGTVALAAPDADALRAWVSDGGVLVVGGDASALFPELGAFVAAEPLGEGPIVGFPVAAGLDWPDADLPIPRWPGGSLGAYVETEGLRLVDADPDGAAVVALAYGDGAVLAIADARLLTNGALVSPANEAFLAAAPYVPVDVGLADLPVPARLQLATRAGEESENPLSSLANARLLPAVLQLLALGALIGLWRGWPFAPLRDPPAEGRRSFAEHVRALGLRYASSRASRRALGAFAGLWLGRVGRAGLELAARRAGLDPAAARDLLARAERAAADPDGDAQPTDLTDLEELWRITRHR